MNYVAPVLSTAYALNRYYRSGAVQKGSPLRRIKQLAKVAGTAMQIQNAWKGHAPRHPQKKSFHSGGHTQKVVARREKGRGSTSKSASKRVIKKGNRKIGVPRQTRKYVKKTIKNYLKFNHGPKMTIELFQKYALDTTAAVNAYGILNSAFEEQAFAFMPIFVNSQMSQEFRINEATAGAGSLGILDPPGQEIYSGGVKTAYTMNWVKNTEQIIIDSLTFRLYLSNTADTKLKLRIVEWVCADSSNIDIVTRATTLYNQQRCFDTSLGYPTAGTIANSNLFKQPTFNMAMIPEFNKFWKKGLFQRTVELLPGESMEIVIPYSNIVWNQAKILKESDAAGPEEYQKGISRMIMLNTIGQVGYDASANSVAAFQATQLNYRAIKKLTAHRMDTWGRDKRNYQLNFVSTETNFTYAGTGVTEAQQSVTGPVKSEFYNTETTD